MHVALPSTLLEWNTTNAFTIEGLNVCVKNTFIDCTEDPPGRSELNRTQSAPPELPGMQDSKQTACSESCNSEASFDEQLVTEEAGDVVENVCSPAPSRKISEDVEKLGETAKAASEQRGLPQPQTISCRRTSDSERSYEVVWTVDARKLSGNDKQAVSPPFDLDFDSQHQKVTFKMMMYPKMNLEQDSKAPGNQQQPSTFKKALGHGSIQLKCEGDLSSTSSSVGFRLGIHASQSAKPDWFPKNNSFIEHSFAKSAMCGLPKFNDVWDFRSVVDSESLTFNIYLWIEARSSEQKLISRIR